MPAYRVLASAKGQTTHPISRDFSTFEQAQRYAKSLIDKGEYEDGQLMIGFEKEDGDHGFLDLDEEAIWRELLPLAISIPSLWSQLHWVTSQMP